MTETATRKESLLTGAISNYLALGTNVAVGIFLTPFIISHVGKTGYGIWTLLSTFVGYYGLLDLGITSAVQRYVALYKGQGNREALEETASTALVTFFCTGLLIVVVSLLLADPCARFFQVPENEAADFKNVFRIIGLAIAISFSTNVFSAIITGYERFVLLNYIHISSILFRAGWIVTALVAGGGIVSIALGNLLSQLFKLVANYLAYRKIMPSGRLAWRQARSKTFRKILYFGGVATVIMIANQMRTALDRVIVGKWVGLADVAVYGIAAQMAEYVMTAIIQGMNVLTPRFANLEGTNDRPEIKKIFRASLQISAFLACGFYMGALLFGEQLIFHWVGRDFADAKYVLWILMTGFVFDLAQHPGIGLMFALNKHHLYAKTIVVEAVMKIALSLLLVSRYGMIGVALGTAVPIVIMRIFVQPLYVSRLIGIGLADYARPLLLQMGIAGVITGGAYYFNIVTSRGDSLGYIVSSMFVASGIYSAVSAALLDKDQKAIIFSRLFKMIRSRVGHSA